jgi:SpoVK/Ycf46/Vps4 family AAA+-type ATPase
MVDLPSDVELAAIFAVHLKRCGRPVELATAEAIAAARGFTGAEVRAVIQAALRRAFREGARDLVAGDLVAACKATVPLSVTAREKVEAIREWGKGRARFASVRADVSSAASAVIRKLA